MKMKLKGPVVVIAEWHVPTEVAQVIIPWTMLNWYPANPL